MIKNLIYVTVEGHELSLVHLDLEERNLVQRLVRRAKQHPDWNDFDCFWTKEVQGFYRSRNVPGKIFVQTTVWQIAQDLSGRLGIATGFVRPDDYLGDLEEIIDEQFDFKNRAFCKATGLSEDMLSHVLAGRKAFSMQSLVQALDKIGYALRILPKQATTVPVSPRGTAKANGKPATVKKVKAKVG